MPHWAAALSRAKIEPWVRDRLHTPQYLRAAIVNETGEMRYAANDFAKMLQIEWPDWRGPQLPEPLRTQVATRVEGQYTGAHLVANINWRGMAHMALVQLRSRSLADQLSENQLTAARHAANGLGNKEIARLMALSPATIRNYLTTIYARLGVKNKLQLPQILSELD